MGVAPDFCFLLSRPSSALPRGCLLCGKLENLMFCSKCQLGQYCTRQHQLFHWPVHKQLCKDTKHKRALFDDTEPMRRKARANWLAVYDGYRLPFILTEAFATWVYGLLECTIETQFATERGLQRLLWTTQTAKHESMVLPEAVTYCFLRMNRDQEAYDFLKWWITTPEDLYGAPGNPYTDIEGEDILESVDVFFGEGRKPLLPTICSLSLLLLLKVRVYLALESFEHAVVAAHDYVKFHNERYWTPVVVHGSLRDEDLRHPNRIPNLLKLEKDIRKLYAAIHRQDKHFWPALFNSKNHAQTSSPKSTDESGVDISLALQSVLKIWDHSAYALDTIKSMFPMHGISGDKDSSGEGFFDSDGDLEGFDEDLKGSDGNLEDFDEDTGGSGEDMMVFDNIETSGGGKVVVE